MKSIIGTLLLLMICCQNALLGQWIPTTKFQSKPINSLIIADDNFFVGTDSGGVYISANKGSIWNKVNGGWSNNSYFGSELRYRDSNLFAAIYGSGIFLSTDNGSSWDKINNGLLDFKVMALAIREDNIFAVTRTDMYISNDNGANWVKKFGVDISGGGYYMFLSGIFEVSKTDIFMLLTAMGTSGNKLIKSNDDGINWHYIFNASYGAQDIVTAIVIKDTNVYLGITRGLSVEDGVLLSTNNGTTWNNSNNGLPSDIIISSFAIKNKDIFLASNHGIYYSDDNAANWTSINDRLIDTSITAISVDDLYILIGSDNGGVYYRPLDEITAIKRSPNFTHSSYLLLQNYPNPFNPNTTIQYTIPQRTFVTIGIYDVLGKEIERIVNEEQNAGNYSVTFYASKLPSGIYFYRMQAGDFVKTKKLILLK